jgi:uncharacterized membrane protein
LGKLLFDRRVGFYAAILAACNYYLIYFSQEARSYSLLVLLTILSFIFLVRFLRHPTRSLLACYIVSIVAIGYTHYYGFFIFAAQAVCMAVVYMSGKETSRILFRRSLIAVVTTGVLLLPLVPIALRGDGSKGLSWIDQPKPWYLVEYLGKFWLSSYPAFVFGVFLALGIVRICRSKKAPPYFDLVILGSWLAFIFVVPYLKGLVSAPILTSRHAIAGLPALIVLAAAGAAFIKRDYIGHLAILLISLMVLYVLHGKNYYYKLDKEQHRDLTRDLISVNVSNIPIYTASNSAERFNFYFVQFGSSIRMEGFGQLEKLLSEGATEKCFWLAGPTRKIRKDDIVDKYRLHEVGMIKRHRTVAFLFANEDAGLDSCPEVYSDTGLFLISAPAE